jgi:mRNA interferase HicA
MIMRHPEKDGQIVVPNHGASEVGAGLQNKIFKDAGLKYTESWWVCDSKAA